LNGSDVEIVNLNILIKKYKKILRKRDKNKPKPRKCTQFATAKTKTAFYGFDKLYLVFFTSYRVNSK
jgi:hypothetical protein